MDKIIVSLVVIYHILFSSLTFANTSTRGVLSKQLVESVRVDEEGKGFVTFEAPLANQPACVKNTYRKMLSFSTKTVEGNAILSLVLTAKATGKTITARGSGQCAHYSSVMESWGYGTVNP